MRKAFSSIAVTLAALAAAATAADDAPPGTIRHHAADLAWKAAPAPLPAGMATVVLEGDPRSGEIFTLRLRAPAGTQLAPHTHPMPERVTVLEGTIGVGFGRDYDAARLHVFHAGDYYVNPPGEPHFVRFIEDAVVQVTGRGPWSVEWISP